MKAALLLLALSSTLWARPVVLIGHFDRFGGAPFNNSERVAITLAEKFKNHPDVEVKLCGLQTVFDKSFYQLEDCYKALRETPKMVLGLGESNCNFKFETMARNLDRTKGPDNEGNQRNSTPIDPNGPKEFGFNFPAADMYCSLDYNARSIIEVSNNAGSFVCNNLAYQFSHTYQDVSFGFIHVPSHSCRNLETKTRAAVSNLEKMILAAAKSEATMRHPTTKRELEDLRAQSRANKCIYEFYKRTKGADEKGFWTFSETN